MRDSFDELYLQFSDKIYKYFYWQTGDPYLAEDFTGEVFARVWKNWKRFKPDFSQAFLYRVARNLLIDYWRKNKNRNEMSLETSIEAGIEPSYDEDFIEKIQNDDEIRKLRDAIKLLPENLKEIIILRFMEELSAKEVGEISGLTEVNVRVLQYRALRKLREVIKNE
ncbi:MAG: RNA polymerase sigma factor [Candidatus Levybacteria bacterium]|nr:RNA polymerase sigma factor [Candidatus Levybacteria bacterium]